MSAMKSKAGAFVGGLVVMAAVWAVDSLLLRPIGRYQLVQAASHAPMRLDTRTGELRVFLDGNWRALPEQK